MWRRKAGVDTAPPPPPAVAVGGKLFLWRYKTACGAALYVQGALAPRALSDILPGQRFPVDGALATAQEAGCAKLSVWCPALWYTPLGRVPCHGITDIFWGWVLPEAQTSSNGDFEHWWDTNTSHFAFDDKCIKAWR